MRKRRRLANKMTIMVCAVLIAASAFFYAPIEVDASENSLFSVTGSGPISFNYGHGSYSEIISLIDNTYDLETYYELIINYDFLVNFQNSGVDSGFMLRNAFFSLSDTVDYRRVTGVSIANYLVPPDEGSKYIYSRFVGQSKIIAKGSDLFNKYLFFDSRASAQYQLDGNFSFTLDVLSINSLTGDESESYMQGYNAGYSAGEQVGESNGYSNGYSDGYEAGEQSGYDSGFQAGSDSVDTQSYYDAGYSAGYDAGYLEGYETGYDVGYDNGWQAYEDKISGWGADTSDYPVYITSSSSEVGFLNGYVYGNSQVYDEESIVLNFDINPNHIYRFDVKLGIPRHSSYSDVYGDYTAVYFCAGGVDYFISPTVNYGEGIYKSIYVRGDMLSSSFSKKGVVTVVSSSVISPGIPAYYSFTDFWHDVQVYDVGPIGNMQNYIANQTDQLTGGYNDSQGNSVNNDFSSGLNKFETAEDSLFATATTGLKDFTFFDFESVPAMVTGMSFVGSIMGSWFAQAGGASGVGIVLSILFSIMLVAMVLGLYRWYQSKGGKD